MSETKQTAPQPRRSQDILEFYRERIMYLLALAILIFITPFAILNFYEGHFLLGLAVVAVIVTFCIDGFAIHLKRRPPIPFKFLLLPTVAAIGITLASDAMHGALWCYPGVLLCYFVLPRRWAITSSLALLAVAAPTVMVSLDQDIAIRFVVSLTMTIVVIYIITDVIRELQVELLSQAITDPLTGAYNRRQMEFALDEAIERHQRTDAPASILLIDIDHFKHINDSFGHDAGDRVLKALVLLIKNRSRKLDRLFRMGGEEFLLLLPDTPAAAAMIQAENLRSRIADGSLLKGRQVTVSIGIAACRRDISQDTWIKTADNALYHAKATGRNRIVNGDTDEAFLAVSSEAEAAADASERRARQR
jgi:diguanylate cyclase (GGDEF)-like protein